MLPNGEFGVVAQLADPLICRHARSKAVRSPTVIVAQLADPLICRHLDETPIEEYFAVSLSLPTR